MQKILISCIKLYQYFLAPWIGQHCRFHPSCSNYAIVCFERFSLLFALYLIVRRLLRCQPFHPGGIDNVPEKLGKING